MSSQYEWLIIVEGNTDVRTYGQLFDAYEISRNKTFLFSANGKGTVCNAEIWNKIISNTQQNLLDTVRNDIGRSNFKGIILIVDSDDNSSKAFSSYKRCKDNSIDYSTPNVPPLTKGSGEYVQIDSMNGVNTIPILGINVPTNKSGCLETDLLAAYGFPIEKQEEYKTFVNIIEKTSSIWNIPKLNGGKNWWDDNRKAKFDKFIYSALSYGFSVCRQKPQLLNEPDVIKRIKEAIKANEKPS